MAHLIDKDALVSEIESKRKYAQTLGDNAINSSMQQFYDGMKQGCVDIISFLDTLEVKDVDLEDYNKVKKVLSLSFMQFLDSHRQEGKMCLSNGECFDIDKAFDELDFAKLFRYMEKYLKAQKGE